MKRLTTLLLGLSASSLALAQPPENEVIQLSPQEEGASANAAPVIDAELDEAARITFQRARAAFDSGDYETALSRFRQAYELSPRPMLLYNIAATLDRLRRDVEAAEALRAYLAADPDSAERVEIEARIRVLDGIIAERTAREQAEADAAAQAEAERRAAEEARLAEEARRNEEPPPSSGLHPAIAIGVGGAALVAGGLIIWSGLNASSRNDTYEAYANTAAPSPSARAEGQRLFDETRSAERRTNALIGVSAALGVAAGVLLIFTDFGGDADEDGVALRAGGTHQGGSMVLEGTF